MAQGKRPACSSMEQRRFMIESHHIAWSVTRQCELLGLPRWTSAIGHSRAGGIQLVSARP